MRKAQRRSVHLCFLFSYFSSAAAILVAGLALVAWLADTGFLRAVIPGYAPMKPNTAIGFLLTAVSLGLSGAWRRAPKRSSPKIARACALVIAVIGSVTLVEYIFQIDSGIDRILFSQVLQARPGPHPGRMSQPAAAGFVFLGLALFLLDSKSRLVNRFSQRCALAAFFIGLLATVGYLYGAESLYRIDVYESTGFHNSLLCVLLGASVLTIRPRSGILAAATSHHLGGLAARRILPVAMAAPLLLGWLCLAGQRAGLYTIEFGIALFTTSNIVLFTVIVRASARLLNRVDAKNGAAANVVQQSGLELKAAHEKLFATEERFRLFMEYLPASAFLKDRDGRYVWGNTAWRRRFPEEWGDLYGKKDTDLWPPEVHTVFGASDQRVLSENAPVQLVETGKVGQEIRHWLVSKFPVQGSGGALLIGGVSFDTTDRKELELQLYQSQKLEAVGLLAGGVAHDFNNLLTVILGFAEEVKLDFQEGRSPVEDLQEITEAAQRAAALTSQLLAFGRKQVLQPRVLNLNAALIEMRRLLRRLLRENIKLDLSLGPDVGMVQVDPTQIQQVVMNLAMNAQDAMPDGGRLTLETSNIDFDDSNVASPRQVQPGSYVQLAVSDTGMGMDPDTQEHIFEPFFTTKMVGRGTGLGLATVYGVVKQSSGYIWVYSEPGQGTSFKIYLPRVSASGRVDESRAPVVEDGAGAAGRTILIAEDEDAVRLLMVKACAKAGYHLLAATSGEEALMLSESHAGSIHLLVTDVIMRGMNGRVLADQIIKHRSEIKVLYCSGYAQNAIMQQGVLGPNAAFLQKPYTAGALLRAIRKVLP